ncbi:peptidylprolyl isomerase [Helicobacter sp. 13S00477-4]|uniref:peptidylprolyl isomerase n=1 Tax=Helicobacter sp. 13S00477-4 TaxID=1905759 RepID=UPI000BA50364|nr:peptidylprolyl isomerase [Helicobacter sp. 13S00477-4]PAF50534.1 hypothetical protein BKH44_07815 [Helicobacter sp. 13S00477-4]
MIEWMQKHKKYLVVTIWISTIAFIAAGMIGWGQYNFSITGDTVAKVGKIKITKDEFDQEYRRIYEAYAQAFNDFTQEQANALKLQDIAMNMVINQALLRNFALDLGLRVEDSEIINEIIHNDAFQNNGHFDENQYKTTLKENNYRPEDFENSLRNAILIQKITALLPDTITPLELSAVSSATALQDKIEILILDTKNIQPKMTESEIKSFWEKNKTSYQYPAQYKIKTIFVKSDVKSFTSKELQEQYNQNKSLYLNEEGGLKTFQEAKEQVKKDIQMQKAQSLALKEYIELKKNNVKDFKVQTLNENSNEYPKNIMEAIENIKENDTIKPIAYKDGYIVIKLLSKKPPQPKSFQEAKPEVLNEFKNQKKIQLLKIEAANKLLDFKGKNIGFVYPTFDGKIEGLNKKEISQLIAHIFTSNKKSDFALIGEKAILYKIIDQNFEHKVENQDKMAMITKNLKTNFLDQMLIDYLKKKYNIKRYY